MILAITNFDLSRHPLGEIPDLGVLDPVEVKGASLTAPSRPIGAHLVFHSEIEWLGPLEPESLLPGLGIFSQLVFFNGRRSEFYSSFSKYRAEESLRGIGGVYLLPDTLLILDGTRFLVQGAGGVMLFRPSTGTDLGLTSDLVQYKPGNAFTLNIEPPDLRASEILNRNPAG
jgi:hypothetical protein